MADDEFIHRHLGKPQKNLEPGLFVQRYCLTLAGSFCSFRANAVSTMLYSQTTNALSVYAYPQLTIRVPLPRRFADE